MKNLLVTPSVTVAICTRDRPRQLGRALESIVAGQTLAPCEVLVVDNVPSNDASRHLIEDRFPQVTYVCEDSAGIGFARNRALQEAAGDIVAFIDDDAVADAGWVRAVVDAMGNKQGLAACTGLVKPLSLETTAQRLFEANGGFARGIERIELPRDATRRLHGRSASRIAWAISIGNGCNFAVDRRAALAVGGFDGTFGGDPLLPGGEDLDLIWRLISGGMTVAYEPGAVVCHEHRRTMTELERQLANHQRGLVGFLTKAAFAARGRVQMQIWLFLSWRLLKPAVRLMRRAVGRDPLPIGILLRMWWATATAPAAYLVARRRVNTCSREASEETIDV